jgi:MFS family permease
VGTVVFSLTCCSTLAMIPMGVISRRVGNKRALQGSLLAGTLVLLAALFARGFFATVLSVLGVACVYSTLPLTVSVAQILAPNERSAASSIVMGLAWGFSNILVSPFGKLADLAGLDAAFAFMAILPLLGLPFFLTRSFIKLDVLSSK